VTKFLGSTGRFLDTDEKNDISVTKFLGSTGRFLDTSQYLNGPPEL